MITEVIDLVNTKVIHRSDGICSMESIGQRLQRIRNERGLSQAALARAAGLKSQGTIGNIESGSRGYGESIVDIAAALNVSPSFLRCETEDEAPHPSHSPVQRVQERQALYVVSPFPPGPDHEQDIEIVEYDTGGKMGAAGLVLKDQPGMIRSWKVSPDWVHKNIHNVTSPRNLAIVTGFGDSMRPLYNPGDPLLIDTGVVTVDFDGVYFFRIGGEGYVKRLQRIPTVEGTVLRAKSDNKDYDPFDIVQAMDFEVFGRVVKVWCGTDF